jgi:hypothetical protein
MFSECGSILTPDVIGPDIRDRYYPLVAGITEQIFDRSSDRAGLREYFHRLLVKLLHPAPLFLKADTLYLATPPARSGRRAGGSRASERRCGRTLLSCIVE